MSHDTCTCMSSHTQFQALHDRQFNYHSNDERNKIHVHVNWIILSKLHVHVHVNVIKNFIFIKNCIHGHNILLIVILTFVSNSLTSFLRLSACLP